MEDLEEDAQRHPRLEQQLDQCLLEDQHHHHPHPSNPNRSKDYLEEEEVLDLRSQLEWHLVQDQK